MIDMLRESERYMRSVVSDMSHGLLVQGPDAAILMSNPAALDALGLTEGQLLGKTSFDPDWHVIHEDGSPFPGTEHPVPVALRTGETVRGVIMGVYRPKHKDYVWLVVDAVLQYHEDGSIARCVCTFIDISERKRAEDAARASDAMFRAVYDNAGLGVILRQPDGLVMDCNIALRRMLGLQDESGKGFDVEQFIHPEDTAGAPELHSELLAGTRDWYEFERRFVRPDGEPLWGHVTVSLVREADDTPRYLVEMIQDISDRKEMETQLLLTDRLASLGTMAAGVGHEINNPLTWLMGNLVFAVDMLKNPNIGSDLAALTEVRESLEEGMTGAERVRTIVRDLRLFSRVDNAPDAAADVNEVIQSTTRMLGNELKHRASLHLDLVDVPPVFGDAARIGQILTNLLVNALHALPKRHRTENQIGISSRLQDGAVVIAVSDNGIGIEPELQSRIFDPFFTTKDIGKGTGLGLSICHTLVTRLGGTIEVRSTLGEGSTFRISLPPIVEAQAGDAAGAGESDTATRKRVLCIDDEPNVGKMVKRFLRGEHEVVTETEGARAVRRLREGEHFDAIICDLMMPDMNGMELFHELSRVAPAMSERCGFITGGFFTADVRAFAEDLPSARLVQKPFGSRAIRDLVDALLG